MSIEYIENENAILKDRIEELESYLIPLSVFSSLLASIRRYVKENIQKRTSLILETWEMETSFVSLSSRMTNFRQYLQVDLENDE
jgi:hypothetical protein